MQHSYMEAIRKGATYELAAKYAGVDDETIRRWLRQAEQYENNSAKYPDYEKFYDFQEERKKAEGDAVVKWLDIIDNAAQNGQWPAAAWKLERRYPHFYGKDSVELKEIKEIYSYLLNKSKKNEIAIEEDDKYYIAVP